MDIIFNGHFCSLFRRLEQGANVNIKADVGIGGGNNLKSPVMPILAHFGDQDTRSSSMTLQEILCPFTQLLNGFRAIGKF